MSINSFSHGFSFFHLENSVISVFSNKAQEVDAPRVHQLIVGGPCHSAGCLGNTGYHTLAVHLLTRSGGGVNTFWCRGLQKGFNSKAMTVKQHCSSPQDQRTWWVTKECSLTSALSLTSFHTSSPYDSLMKSWRLSHSSPYILSLWLETQAEVPILLLRAPASRFNRGKKRKGKLEKHSQWQKFFVHTAEEMLMCLAPSVNLLDAGS